MTVEAPETPVLPLRNESEALSAPDGVTTAESDSDQSENSSSEPKGNREARYRTERNSARDERDTLAQRIESLQTRELERIASKHLSNPADLLTLSGKSLADFVGEDGELDAEAIHATADYLLGSRPGLRPGQAAHDRSQGLGDIPKSQPTWGSLLSD
jgi:hypothetical protein